MLKPDWSLDPGSTEQQHFNLDGPTQASPAGLPAIEALLEVHSASPEETQEACSPERPSLGQLQKVSSELTELQSLNQKRSERIEQLEKALDQTLSWFHELQSKIHEQQFLESQLALTEEYANLQYQEINRLKQQLSQQLQPPETECSAPATEEQLMQGLLQEFAVITQAQSGASQASEGEEKEPEEAEARVISLPEPLGQKLRVLQACFVTLSQRLSELKAQLSASRITAADLEKQCRVAQQRSSEREATISLLREDLKVAYASIEALKKQSTRQAMAQAQLQHSHQEREAERDRLEARAADLEHQTFQMQEQILQQAQETAEYEMAIQHWRDRYLTSQDFLRQLKESVQKHLPSPPPELAVLLATLDSAEISDWSEVPSAESLASSDFKKGLSVELPTFLAHRRNWTYGAD